MPRRRTLFSSAKSPRSRSKKSLFSSKSGSSGRNLFSSSKKPAGNRKKSLYSSSSKRDKRSLSAISKEKSRSQRLAKLRALSKARRSSSSSYSSSVNKPAAKSSVIYVGKNQGKDSTSDASSSWGQTKSAMFHPQRKRVEYMGKQDDSSSDSAAIREAQRLKRMSVAKKLKRTSESSSLSASPPLSSSQPSPPKSPVVPARSKLSSAKKTTVINRNPPKSSPVNMETRNESESKAMSFSQLMAMQNGPSTSLNEISFPKTISRVKERDKSESEHASNSKPAAIKRKRVQSCGVFQRLQPSAESNDDDSGKRETPDMKAKRLAARKAYLNDQMDIKRGQWIASEQMNIMDEGNIGFLNAYTDISRLSGLEMKVEKERIKRLQLQKLKRMRAELEIERKNLKAQRAKILAMKKRQLEELQKMKKERAKRIGVSSKQREVSSESFYFSSSSGYGSSPFDLDSSGYVI